MIGFVLFLLFFATGYVVSHAWSIRVARALEAGGRLRGRGTVLVFAGPLVLVAYLIALVVVAISHVWLGLEPFDPEAMSVWDSLAAGILVLIISGLGGWTGYRVAVALSPRRRGRPPVRMLEILAPVLRLAGTAVIPTMVVGLLVAFVIGWRTRPPRGFDYLWLAVLVPLLFWLCFYYGSRGHDRLHSLAEQWSSSPTTDQSMTLYLRPFDEERTLFAPGRTLEEFLGPEIRARLGEFVGLGSPQDRLPPPGGARRVYHSDESWQDALEDLAETSRCIVGAMASSANTDWELSRIRQLDLQSKLFLVSPPAEGEDAGDPIGDSTSWWRFFAAVANAYVDMDTDRLTKILARGHAPRALTAAPPVAWSDLARVLTTCGYAVPIDDPGPGAVVGFDSVGTAVLLAAAAEAPSDFVDPMIARVG